MKKTNGHKPEDSGASPSETALPYGEHPGARFRDEMPGDAFAGSTGLLFEQAMAQTRMAVVLTDPHKEDNPIIFANRAFRALTGYDEKEVIGHNCRFLQGPETDGRAVERIRRAIETEDVLVVELLNYRKDGSKFWNALHIGPVYDDAGKLLYFFGSQWDVTDVHAARADEAIARAMARELSHRMKNMFSVISAIVSMTGVRDGVSDSTDKINGRIRALGRAYESTLDLTRSATAVDLNPVVRTILLPYDPTGGSRLRLSGGDVRIDPNIVSLLGLVLHELATNAVKYGALREEDGVVEVNWRVEEPDRLKLLWIERDGPRIDEPPNGGGMGSGIVQNLLRLVGGSIELRWRAEGLEARMSLPLAS